MRVKKYRKFLIVMMMVLLYTTPVCAMDSSKTDHKIDADLYDSSGEYISPSATSKNTGSITVKLQDTENDTSKSNVKIAIAKVADVIDGEFVLEQKFTNAQVDLNTISSADETEAAVEALMSYATPDQIFTTNTEGIVEIEDIAVGVYLIYEADAVTYAQIAPSLISLPMYNEQTCSMNYEIEVIPKYIPIDVEVERSGIFQTGIKNYALEYAGIPIMMFFIAVVILCAARNRKTL